MILQNPRVVFSVAWFDPDNLKKRKGIQGVGMCRVMTDEWEISEALDFHHKKFTEFKDEITAEWIKNNEWDSRAWVVDPISMKYWDDEVYGDDESQEFNFVV